MSRENVESVRRFYEIVKRAIGPAAQSEHIQQALVELLHPDVSWHDPREMPGATVHRGIEAVERHLATLFEVIAYETVELLEILDVGRWVVASYRFHARGRSSRVPVTRDSVAASRFRGAKVERVEMFGTKEEALAAVGRPE